MGDQSHLSIGEVLSLLQEEFPDVTISKIRFLESQGLLDPERTPSGYRKFYESDIEKLRWILTEQRDHFLPLKVIRDRLDENGGRVPPPEPQGVLTEPVEVAASPAAAASAAPLAASSRGGAQPVWMADHARRSESIHPAAGAGSVAASVPAEPVGAAGRLQANQASLPLDTGPTTASFTFDELLSATGLTASQARSLEQYGLLTSREAGPDTVYDPESLVIAQKAAAFFARGIEARHLRMYKVAAEREAGFLEQVVTPMLKQRNPTARRQAVEMLNELLDLGDTMRAALLRQALQGYIAPRL
jgi:DNA-binding transcriptional MerR regulator